MDRQIVCYQIPAFEIALARLNDSSLRNRPVGIVAVASGLAHWTVGAKAAIASQIELLWNSSWRRPAQS